MKVLTILHSLSIGGIEKTLYHCIPGLQNANIKMTICCFSKGGNLEEDFKAQGVNVVYIKKTGSFFLDFLQLYQLLKKNDFDIVHSRLSYTSGGFALACRLLKIPFFVSIHNEFPATMIKWAKKPILSQLRKVYLESHKFLTLRFSSLIIGHSRSNLDRNFANWENSSQFKVLYNGVDFEYLKRNYENVIGRDSVERYMEQFGKNSFNIIHVGTFKEQKNHLFMLDCFHKLDPKHHNYHLILLGDGELRKQIEDKIERCELQDNVHLVGFSKDIGAWLMRSDLFFFPSKFEGFANVLIEAQYLEVPILASKIRPHFESVHSFYHEYFFSPTDGSDCVNELGKMIALVKEGAFHKESKNIKEYIESRFSIDEMANNLASIYNSYKK